MFNKKFFCINRGGATMLLFLFICLSKLVQGQDCQSLDAACEASPSRFRVQVIPDPDYPNTSECPTSAACGDGDQFRQLFFKARLVYVGVDQFDNLSFTLDYDELTVMVRPVVTNAVAGAGYSFIDTKATDMCFGEIASANSWSGVTFLSSETEVYINFEHDIANECPSNIIQFSPNSTDCSFPYCATADLFRIVVNAYPGEEVNPVCELALYSAPGEGICEMTATEQEETALLPDVGSSEPIEVRLKEPEPLSNGCSIEVEVVNHGSTSESIDYLEFVLKIETDQVMAPEVVSDYDRPPLIDGTTRYIHFIVPDEGWTLSGSGGTHSIGVININPPQLSNTTWNATLTLMDGSKSRLKTPTDCRNLPLSSEPESCEIIGNDPCAYDDGGVIFTIEGLTPDECEDPFTKKINIGFRDTETGTTDILNLKSLEFSLEIGVVGDVEFEEVNGLTGWPVGICPTTSTCTPCVNATRVGDIIYFSYCVIIPDGTAGHLSIDPDSTAFLELVFEEAGCIESVTLTSLSLRRNGDTEVCVPTYDAGPYDGIPICPPQIFGTIATDLGDGVEGAKIGLAFIPNTDLVSPDVQPTGCDTTACPKEWFMGTSGTAESGSYGFCPCQYCRYFNLIPKKNDNPLNGVTTYDLVLISKHILATEPLNTPYKMIAADANKSGSITTFDISEFRKLILGIYDTIPGNTSWRFVDKAFSFPNPNNPFQTIFPERNKEPIDMVATPAKQVSFVAIKIGDVNYSAMANRPAERPTSTVSWSGSRAKKGEVLTIPVTYSGAESLEAIQLGLRYDPAVLQLLGPSQGELAAWGPDNFNLTNPGEVRTLWLPADPSDPEQMLTQGKVLFYLTFKVNAAIPDTGLPIWLDNTLLDNAAWRNDGTECALTHGNAETVQRTPPNGQALTASCRPNPSSGQLTFSIKAPEPGKTRIALYSPFGVRVLAQDVLLSAGEQEIDLPEAAHLPAGVYVWKVLSRGNKLQGHWVKQ